MLLVVVTVLKYSTSQIIFEYLARPEETYKTQKFEDSGTYFEEPP